MKKFVIFLLTVALIIPFCPTSAYADYAYSSSLNGVENVFLSYTFSSSPSSGHRSEKQYEPLVGYYDADGNLTDSYFDSFLFLPCVCSTPSGGYTYYSENNPNNFSDWKGFVDDCFLDGYNIPALNSAVGNFKKKMGSSYNNYKVKVFLTCLYPVRTQTDFGDIDGDGISESFAVYENRVKAIRWLVDEQIKRFNSGGYSNLELVGFYWFEETVYSETYGKQIIKDFNSIVHENGLKTIWIPFYTANSKELWRSLNFDVACLQPNYMFYDVGASRVNEACAYAKANGMCIEIESFGSVLSKTEYYNRYLTYLEGCINNGADKAIKMYYNDAVPGVYYNAYASSDARSRSVYDLTYKFAKGTLKASDIVYAEEKSKYDPSNYDIVTYGKSYTATAPYTNGDADYTNIDGKELTDGVFGKADFSTEWHAFHISNKESDGTFIATVDLGKIESNINYFAAEFQSNPSAGISLPSSVSFEVSADGKSFTKVGDADLTDNEGGYDYHIASLTSKEGYDARYIRIVITKGSLNFVFCSEVLAGRSLLSSEKGYKNVALGASYTATEAYTETTVEYGSVDGKELTDGIFGTTQLGTEWHAFHISKIKDGENYTVVIDLGKNFDCLSKFTSEYELYTAASIALPESVTYYASTDGKSYTKLGSVQPVLKSGYLYTAVLNTSNLVSARYIKVEIERGKANFVFCSEITAEQNLSYTDVIDDRFIGIDYYDAIPEKTTFDDFCNTYSGKYTADKLASNGYIATGTLITCDGHSFTAVVKGDLNSDGTVTAIDYMYLKSYILGKLDSLDKYQLIASDINADGINAIDYLIIKRHVLGLYNIYGD